MSITVSSAAGTFMATSGGSCSGGGIAFTANVTLLAGQTNHLEVCETPCFCPVTICKQRDRTGALLDIVQTVPAVNHRIEGKKIVFKDKATDANKRKLAVQSKDVGIAAPESGDEPTAVGAQLRIVRPGPGGEATTMMLPVPGWKGLGKPPGVKGYLYADPDRLSGPCTKVLLKPGKTLKALCFGAGIGFDLDEAQQNDLAVDLTMGTTHHCMEFGGILKDQGTSVAKVGLFKAADSAAPISCPP